MTLAQPPAPPLRLPSRRTLSLGLLAAAGFYIAYAGWTGGETLRMALAAVSWHGPAAVVGAASLNYLLRFLRWQYYLRLWGHRLPWRLHLLYYLAGFALTTTPGKAGETVRSLYLHRHGVRYSESLGAFFVERLLDVVVLLFLASLAAGRVPGLELVPAAAAGLLLAVLVFLVSGRGLGWLRRRLQRDTPSRLRHLAAGAVATLENAHRLLRPSTLALGLALGLAAWTAQGLAFLYLLHLLGLDLDWTRGLGGYALGLLGGAASLIPGGIGATEAVLSVLLLGFGAGKAVALTAPLILRLGTLWYAVALGFAATAVLGLTGRGIALAGHQNEAVSRR